MNRYLIGISILLNAVLLMFLFGVLPFALYLSIILNIIFIWYIRNNLASLEEVREDLVSTLEIIESFSDHLDRLHELETFYGDETLQTLINHSREVINDLVDLQEKYYDLEVGLETYDDNEEAEEEETPEEEK
tara:strand:- start:282 stop:680 length:399 start_codon:yes stop_codon:yes gene_type:complete